MAHVGTCLRFVSTIVPHVASRRKRRGPDGHLAGARALVVGAVLAVSIIFPVPTSAQGAFLPACSAKLRDTWWIENPTLARLPPGQAVRRNELCQAIYDTQAHSELGPQVDVTLVGFGSFRSYIEGLGYGISDTDFAVRLFKMCYDEKLNPSVGHTEERLAEIQAVWTDPSVALDTLLLCSNAAEVTLGQAWAEHVGTSVGAELLIEGWPPIESVDVDNLVVQCLRYQVGSVQRTLWDMRKICGQAIAESIHPQAATTLTGCSGAGRSASAASASDELAVARFQDTNDPEESCPCGCLAPPEDTSPAAVSPESPPPPPATPAPAASAPTVATQSVGTLWNVKVQAASGSTSTWTATWTLRSGTTNEFDVNQVRFDGSVTTYHLKVTIGSDNKVRAEAFGDMQGPSSCSQLTLEGTLVGNTVSDGTYTCVGYAGKWQATVEGRG